MNVVDQATTTQLKNIQEKTGKNLDELTALVQQSGLSKHGEIRAMLQRDLGLGYGDANTLTHHVLKAGATAAASPRSDPIPPAAPALDDLVASFYSGGKAALRPVHDRLMQAAASLGEFEIAPKKDYLSLRRKKQFAMIGPATTSRVEVGLNCKTLPASPRLIEQPAGSMCSHKVRVSHPEEVNDELVAWLRQAYDSAG